MAKSCRRGTTKSGRCKRKPGPKRRSKSKSKSRRRRRSKKCKHGRKKTKRRGCKKKSGPKRKRSRRKRKYRASDLLKEYGYDAEGMWGKDKKPTMTKYEQVKDF